MPNSVMYVQYTFVRMYRQGGGNFVDPVLNYFLKSQI
jgi:hypothetical protein